MSQTKRIKKPSSLFADFRNKIILFDLRLEFLQKSIGKQVMKNHVKVENRRIKENYMCITILLHRSSIFPARAWYLFACFLISAGTFDRSVLPTFSKFWSSCSSNFNLEEIPVDSPSTFHGDSLLNRKCPAELHQLQHYKHKSGILASRMLNLPGHIMLHMIE